MTPPPSPDHSAPAPTKSLTQYRVAVAAALEALGYGKAHVEGFLAGATLLGHLRPGGCLWYVDHAVRHRLTPAHSRNDILEKYGQPDFPDKPNPNPNPNPKTK